jgi:molecular chaperone DnaJ
MISDPYEMLGVSSTDSDEEITKAYRRMARKYHPDLNPGNEEAAKRMSEINAAYDQIKNGNAYKSGSGGYSGQGPYGGQNNWNNGNNSSEGNNPFGSDSNPFEEWFNIFGSYGDRQQQGQKRSAEFDPVRHYLRSGYYQEAVNVLNSVDYKGAEWYYYSSIANSGIDNKITALNHAKTAVQMEPNNLEYQRILNQIQNGGHIYRERSQGFGMPTGNVCRICLGLYCANMMCRLCLFTH